MENSSKKLMNLELLRCVAMMMVIVLHFLGKGGILPKLADESYQTVDYAAWILESLSIVAVNVYMMISGYLLCASRFKWSRLANLMLQLLFYSIVFGLLGAALGTTQEEVSVYYLLRLCFPVFMEHYWFMTAYILLYMLLPFLLAGLERMDRKQHLGVTLLFLGAFCVLKSVLPFRFTLDQKGYDVFWYLTVFLAAAYVRKYGVGRIKGKGRALVLYFAGAALVFAGQMAYRWVYLRTGKLQSTLGVCMEYNHLFCFLAALGLFLFFLQVEVRGALAKAAGALGPLTLGVYLLHENLGFRYAWQRWVGADRVAGPASLVLYTLLAVAAVFAAGIAVEYVRRLLMRPLERWIEKKIGEK